MPAHRVPRPCGQAVWCHEARADRRNAAQRPPNGAHPWDRARLRGRRPAPRRARVRNRVRHGVDRAAGRDPPAGSPSTAPRLRCRAQRDRHARRRGRSGRDPAPRLRGFSNAGTARVGDAALPVRGRVSMDLLIVDVSAMPTVAEGEWVGVDYDLRTGSTQSGLSQYELLTGLGGRFDRRWG
ncbi:hypothetical protein FKL64_23600 [Escherichia coli]|nr:hypothetical protein [Escherichia coli]